MMLRCPPCEKFWDLAAKIKMANVEKKYKFSEKIYELFASQQVNTVGSCYSASNKQGGSHAIMSSKSISTDSMFCKTVLL